MALAAALLAVDPAPGIGVEGGAPAPASSELCALLDDANAVAGMDGRLLYLAQACGREAEFLGGTRQAVELPAESGSPGPANVPVSDPLQDTSGTSRTESETAIAFNPITGTLCAAWLDTFHGVTEGTGYSGFGRSTDGGATFTDLGAFPVVTYGDPSMVWRKLQGKFYFAALSENGITVFRSDTDCASFVEVGLVGGTGAATREMMAADNTPGSPRNGWLYLAWRDVQVNEIKLSRSADGGATWSVPVSLPSAAGFVLGAWPAVAPNGDLFVAWLRGSVGHDPIHTEVVKSSDGGATFSLLPPPMTGKPVPRDLDATWTCAQLALRGYVRQYSTPKIAVDASGNLHVVYSYDPDGLDVGDVSNVYYRRSTTGGESWGPELLVNDDATDTDQWQPSLSVGAGNVVTIGYYSRQLDPVDNVLFDYYSRTSLDGGVWFESSVRMTDASSSVVLDPNFGAPCYHGDYDTQTHGGAFVHMLWSDDRDPGCPGCGADPNVWTRPTAAGTDFALAMPTLDRRVCVGAAAGYEIDVLKFQDFSEPVTLVAVGNPAGTSVGFSENAQVPPFVSTLTVGATESAPDTSSAITITGTAIPSLAEHSRTVALTIDGAAPEPPDLISPPDLTSGAAARPMFSWSPVAGAVDYILEIDDAADFSTPVYQATVGATVHAPSTRLPSDVVLYWRVRPENACGAQNASLVHRLAVPTRTLYCREPNLPIPDHQETGIDDVLTVPAGVAEISALEIDLTVSHTWVSDLTFSLSHDGIPVVFLDQPGVPIFVCDEDDIDVRVSDDGPDGDVESACSHEPGGPAISGDRIGGDPANATLLSTFAGTVASGDWTLHAIDHWGGDNGTIDSWCLVMSGFMPFLDGFESGDSSRWSSTVSAP